MRSKVTHWGSLYHPSPPWHSPTLPPTPRPPHPPPHPPQRRARSSRASCTISASTVYSMRCERSAAEIPRAKPNPGPSRRHEHQYRHLSGRQVLLIAEVLIGRDEEFSTILFRPIEQGAIPQLRPSSFKGRVHTVLRQVTPKRYRCSLIKQDLHEATVSASSPSS